MGKNDRIVQRRPDGGYEVVAPKHERASAVAPTQGQAERRAKQIVDNPLGGGEVIVRRVQNPGAGQFRDKDTIGRRDPRTSKDKRH